MADATSVPESVYGLDPVFNGIRTRFDKVHGIDITAHMKSMTKLCSRTEEGFFFVPVDAAAWEAELKRAGFLPDVRETHLGFIPSVGKLASLATHGQGYREKGSPSLHCAVARDVCNVHLDNIGFRLNGYGPDAGQHIVDELLWQSDVAPALGKVFSKLHVDVVGDLLLRTHPIVPNSLQFKPFGEAGAQFDIASGRSKDLQRRWRVTIDITKSCSDATCGGWKALNGKSVELETKKMVMFTVTGW